MGIFDGSDLKTIFRVQPNTNYEGDEVDLIDGDDGADADVDGDVSPTSRRSGDDDAIHFPSPEAPVRWDMSSPVVGENFHLRRRLNKSRENMAWVFG
jgi:hypothetical protein